MSDEDKIKATVFFMDTLSKRQLAEFIVNLNGAVDGLSRNNADYSRVFGEKCAEIARLTAALKRAEAAEARAERYERWLQRIDNWAKAYPLDIFPEPDFREVHKVLAAAGISLDQVSASNMRHVIKGVGWIAENALKGGEE